YIRGMMERAGTFTAVSGWGEIVIGVTAIIAALVAARQSLPWGWAATWLAEAGIAAGISMLLYGAAVVSAGTYSVRSVPVMGAAFMLIGAATFIVPATWSTELMI